MTGMDVFYWLFNMSIAAAITGLPVMLLRQIKRLPRRLSVFLWLIPFCRMVIPVGLASPYGLMSLISQVTGKTVVVFQSGEDVAFSAVNFTMAADQYFPITYKSTVLEQVFAAATVVWPVPPLAIGTAPLVLPRPNALRVPATVVWPVPPCAIAKG